MISLDFSCGEAAAESALQDICAKGGEILYEHYLERTAYAHAAEVTTDSLLSHLRMCFVRHDHSPHFTDSWTEEALVPPNEIDSWSRQCVNVQNMSERSADKQLKSTRVPTASSSVRVDVRPVRDKKKEKDEDDRKKKIMYQEKIPDGEEVRCREVKLIEERRLKEEKQRLQEELRRKQAKEAELQALQEEMDKNPHTFDSEGNLIWISPPNVQKLPKTTQELPYKCTSAALSSDVKEAKPKDEEKPRGKVKSKSSKKAVISSPKSSIEFTDTFTKLASEQPPIIDTMLCKAGVTLGLDGRTKKGPKFYNPVNQMSRASYEELISADKPELAKESMSEEKSPEVLASPEDRKEELPPVKVNAADLPKGSGEVYDFNVSVVQDPSWGVNPITDEPKKADMSAPTTTKNWSMKRNAIGNLGRLPRHHSAMLGTGYGGFSRCLPQPVMGATMGHGLSSTDTFFFPPKDRLPKKEIARVQKAPFSMYMSRSSSEFRQLGAKLVLLNRKSGMADGAIRSEQRGRVLMQSAVD